MRVLMLSTDAKLLDPKSEVSRRTATYGSLMEELYIVVYASPTLPQMARLADNVFVYSTQSRRRINYFFDAYKIIASLMHMKFSVITCQDPFETGLMGWLVKKRYQIPLHLQIHTDILSPYFIGESFKNRLRVVVARWLLSRADGIRVVSERIKSSLMKYYSAPKLNSEPVVLPVFVNARKIQQRKIKTSLKVKYPEASHIILMASRLTKEKNIGIAIKAMQKVQAAFPKTLLVIVGNGPELPILQKKAGQSGASIVWESWTDDLVSYYKTSDIFMLTSNYEGYGRTIIEAMAAGVPVVMTDVGLVGEMLIDDLDGKVIPIGDADALASTLIEMIGNQERGEEYVKNAFKMIEELPDEKEYIKLYVALLEKTAHTKSNG